MNKSLTGPLSTSGWAALNISIGSAFLFAAFPNRCGLIPLSGEVIEKNESEMDKRSKINPSLTHHFLHPLQLACPCRIEEEGSWECPKGLNDL